MKGSSREIVEPITVPATSWQQRPQTQQVHPSPAPLGQYYVRGTPGHPVPISSPSQRPTLLRETGYVPTIPTRFAPATMALGQPQRFPIQQQAVMQLHPPTYETSFTRPSLLFMQQQQLKPTVDYGGTSRPTMPPREPVLDPPKLGQQPQEPSRLIHQPPQPDRYRYEPNHGPWTVVTGHTGHTSHAGHTGHSIPVRPPSSSRPTPTVASPQGSPQSTVTPESPKHLSSPEEYPSPNSSPSPQNDLVEDRHSSSSSFSSNEWGSEDGAGPKDFQEAWIPLKPAEGDPDEPLYCDPNTQQYLKLSIWVAKYGEMPRESLRAPSAPQSQSVSEDGWPGKSSFDDSTPISPSQTTPSFADMVAAQVQRLGGPTQPPSLSEDLLSPSISKNTSLYDCAPGSFPSLYNPGDILSPASPDPEPSGPVALPERSSSRDLLLSAQDTPSAPEQALSDVTDYIDFTADPEVSEEAARQAVEEAQRQRGLAAKIEVMESELRILEDETLSDKAVSDIIDLPTPSPERQPFSNDREALKKAYEEEIARLRAVAETAKKRAEEEAKRHEEERLQSLQQLQLLQVSVTSLSCLLIRVRHRRKLLEELELKAKVIVRRERSRKSSYVKWRAGLSRCNSYWSDCQLSILQPERTISRLTNMALQQFNYISRRSTHWMPKLCDI